MHYEWVVVLLHDAPLFIFLFEDIYFFALCTNHIYIYSLFYAQNTAWKIVRNVSESAVKPRYDKRLTGELVLFCSFCK